MTALLVEACGPMTTLQDGGRFGSQRFGVSTSGAMDRWGLAQANTLVGNPPGAGAVEFMLLGGSFTVADGPARVALAGAAATLTIDGDTVQPGSSATVRPGQRVTVGALSAGIFAYLAIGDGFDLPEELGSLSLQPRAAIGGFRGRALQPGDQLPLAAGKAPDGPDLTLPPASLEPEAPIRVVLGPQDDYFDADAIAAFLSNTYRVSPEADRMGFRLAGPAIAHLRGFNIVSDGIVAGSIQVPGSGVPIVNMADHQTTGGYPKIATIVSPDIGILAQRRTGAGVRFAAVDVEEAQRIAREYAAAVVALPSRAQPACGRLPGVAELLRLNLAGAAADALAPEI